ncbi:hypothetical protein AVEN_65601-1 [Araneus ventricosus]|uniref:Ig-like domain-containing protein n=1 Tax=Araneus ventricosus TaxID=182803 RepID=A0A4Y2P3T8_ARAVE|nr:hypothetical protein AVEN_65601-1 [Araneus ventricosus]
MFRIKPRLYLQTKGFPPSISAHVPAPLAPLSLAGLPKLANFGESKRLADGWITEQTNKMGIEDEKAPTFVQKPKLREDAEEDIIIFECVVAAYPKPDVVWYFENNVIKKTDKLTPVIKDLSVNRFYIALKLHDPEDEDSGLYRLTVTNKKGDATGSIKANFRAVEEHDP